jgi:hypothetical protein
MSILFVVFILTALTSLIYSRKRLNSAFSLTESQKSLFISKHMNYIYAFFFIWIFYIPQIFIYFRHRKEESSEGGSITIGNVRDRYSFAETLIEIVLVYYLNCSSRFLLFL